MAHAIAQYFRREARAGRWGPLAAGAEVITRWSKTAGLGMASPLPLISAADVPFVTSRMAWFLELIPLVIDADGGKQTPAGQPHFALRDDTDYARPGTPDRERGTEIRVFALGLPEPWYISSLRRVLYAGYLFPLIFPLAPLIFTIAAYGLLAFWGVPPWAWLISANGHYFAVMKFKREAITALQYRVASAFPIAMMDFFIIAVAVQPLHLAREFFLGRHDEAAVMEGSWGAGLEGHKIGADSVPAPMASEDKARAPREPRRLLVFSATSAAIASEKIEAHCAPQVGSRLPVFANSAFHGSFVLRSAYFINRLKMLTGLEMAYLLRPTKLLLHKKASLLCLRSPAGHCGLVRINLRAKGSGAVIAISKGLTFRKKICLWATCCLLSFVFLATGFGLGLVFHFSMKDPGLGNPFRLGASAALAICGLICSLPFWFAARRWARAARPDLGTVAAQLETIINSSDEVEPPGPSATESRGAGTVGFEGGV